MIFICFTEMTSNKMQKSQTPLGEIMDMCSLKNDLIHHTTGPREPGPGKHRVHKETRKNPDPDLRWRHAHSQNTQPPPGNLRQNLMYIQSQ